MRYRRTFTPHPRLRKKREKFLKQKITLIILAILALIALLSFISHNEYLTIDTITIEGNRVLASDDVRASVQSELSGKYLLLFAKSNIFIYPKKKIKETLSNTYTRIKDIRIALENLKSLRSISVSITEREGKYLWCGDSPLENNDVPSCYYVDDSGFLFAEAPYFSGNVFFRFYGGAGLAPSGSFVVPPLEFERLIFFKDFLGDINIASQALVIKEGGNYELILDSGETTKAPKIIFNRKDDFEKILNNLDSALDTEPLKTKMKENFSSLLYIDLRYDNKVVYKFD